MTELPSNIWQQFTGSLHLSVPTMLRIWDTYLLKGLLSTRSSPLTSLFDNNAFHLTIHYSQFLSWTENKGMFFYHILTQGTLPPLSRCYPYCHNPLTAWLENSQLKLSPNCAPTGCAS